MAVLVRWANWVNWFSQIGSVTKLSLRTILERPGSSLAAVLGIAGVVAVLVGVLSIAQGFVMTMQSSAAPDTALVMRTGATSEMMSGLSHQDVQVISEAPGVVRETAGPLASGELFVIINLPKRSTGTDANVPLRGVGPNAPRIRRSFEILEGRSFERGRNEVIVGSGAALEFEGLEVGGTIPVGKQSWEVVGVFATGGDLSESEIWTDATVLQQAYNRGNSYQSVRVRLESTEDFKSFKDALTTDPRLNVKVLKQTDYYAEQSQILTNIITTLGFLVAGLMALGAVFGALNTMYTAVAARTREIATLRALGFHGGPIVISVLLESLVLALAGGLLGGALAYVAFDGFRAATMNWASFSQVTFAFAVTPPLLVLGAVWAALIGLLGGFFPAVRAARMPVAAALREN